MVVNSIYIHGKWKTMKLFYLKNTFLYQLVIPYPIFPVGSAAACIH